MFDNTYELMTNLIQGNDPWCSFLRYIKPLCNEDVKTVLWNWKHGNCIIPAPQEDIDFLLGETHSCGGGGNSGGGGGHSGGGHPPPPPSTGGPPPYSSNTPKPYVNNPQFFGGGDPNLYKIPSNVDLHSTSVSVLTQNVSKTRRDPPSVDKASQILAKARSVQSVMNNKSVNDQLGSKLHQTVPVYSALSEYEQNFEKGRVKGEFDTNANILAIQLSKSGMSALPDVIPHDGDPNTIVDEFLRIGHELHDTVKSFSALPRGPLSHIAEEKADGLLSQTSLSSLSDSAHRQSGPLSSSLRELRPEEYTAKPYWTLDLGKTLSAFEKLDNKRLVRSLELLDTVDDPRWLHEQLRKWIISQQEKDPSFDADAFCERNGYDVGLVHRWLVHEFNTRLQDDDHSATLQNLFSATAEIPVEEAKEDLDVVLQTVNDLLVPPGTSPPPPPPLSESYYRYRYY